MARANLDRVVVSFYISRAGKAAVEAHAAERGQSVSDSYRELLRLGLMVSTSADTKPRQKPAGRASKRGPKPEAAGQAVPNVHPFKPQDGSPLRCAACGGRAATHRA